MYFAQEISPSQTKRQKKRDTKDSNSTFKREFIWGANWSKPYWEKERTMVRARGSESKKERVRVKYDHIHNYWDHSFFISLLSPTLLNHHSASKWSKTNSVRSGIISPTKKKERKEEEALVLSPFSLLFLKPNDWCGVHDSRNGNVGLIQIQILCFSWLSRVVLVS